MNDFWSRRKAAVKAETTAELVEAREEVLEATAAEKTDEEILEELGLPDPDSMEEGDDFSAFMTDFVPARLKTRALRKLWRLNPVLANIDGLVDYGEDFTDASMVIENMQTTYQVGKGMMAHVKEMARQALEKEEGPQYPSVEIEEDGEPMIEETIASRVDEDAPVEVTETVTDTAPQIETAATAPRHRMQFQFEDQPTA